MEGLRWDRGYISPYFINDAKQQKVELDNPFILLVDKKISSLQSILSVLEHSVQQGRPVLLVAEDLETEALYICWC